MRTYLKITSPWTQLGLFMGLLAGAMIITYTVSAQALVSMGLVVIQDGNRPHFNLADPHVVSLLKLLQGFSSLGIFLLPSLLYALMSFRYRPVWFLGFHPAEKNTFYLLAIGLAFISLPLAGWLGEINQHVNLPASLKGYEKDADAQMEAFLRAKTPMGVFINIFIIAFLPAVCEEACFRGSLQRILIHAFKSPWGGIVVTAIFFSAFHMQFEGFLPRVFLGLVLGVLYWYSGSLWVSILAHFVINGIQVAASIYYPKMVHENPSVPLSMALLSAVLVVLLIIRSARLSDLTYSKVYEVEKVNETNEFIS